MSNLLQYTLRIADRSLILGQRMSEWCSKGPTLEEDIAMSNIALDLFGQANGFYEYASELDGIKSADDLAFKRNEREFFNHQLTEQENGNFGTTTVRNFLHDAFNFLFYTELSSSKDETLSALASKSLKEVKYHLRHSSNWLIRLGDGTNESNLKAQDALEFLWQYTGELFEMDEIDNEMLKLGIGVDVFLTVFTVGFLVVLFVVVIIVFKSKCYNFIWNKVSVLVKHFRVNLWVLLII